MSVRRYPMNGMDTRQIHLSEHWTAFDESFIHRATRRTRTLQATADFSPLEHLSYISMLLEPLRGHGEIIVVIDPTRPYDANGHGNVKVQSRNLGMEPTNNSEFSYTGGTGEDYQSTVFTPGHGD